MYVCLIFQVCVSEQPGTSFPVLSRQKPILRQTIKFTYPELIPALIIAVHEHTIVCDRCETYRNAVVDLQMSLSSPTVVYR